MLLSANTKVILVFTVLLLTAGVFWLAAPIAEVSAQCTDECVVSSARRCAADDLGYQVCGNYDSDKCLEWSSIRYCGWGMSCGDDVKCVSACDNECLYSGQRRCAGDGKGYQICGNYDADKCLEWSYARYCQDNKVCISGECGYACSDECGFSGQKYCSDDSTAKVCGYYDADPCLDWQTVTCSGSTQCGYGKCDNTQRPYWKCWNGQCDYDCQYRPSCEPNYSTNVKDHLGCYDNDVYWYDERGRRQQKEQECGDYYCGSWSGEYCVGNDVYRKKTCYQPTCSSGQCQFEESPLLQLREKCPSGQVCRAGECKVEESRECSQGACCDGNNYKDTDVVCGNQTQTEYGCPWGTTCGSAVGKRIKTKFQYCSGNSGLCAGNWSDWGNWTGWLVAGNCSMNQVCLPGQSTCQFSTACPQTSKGASIDTTSKDEPVVSVSVCPKCPEQTDGQDKDKDKDKSGVTAFLSLNGLKTILLSWVFWLSSALAAIAAILAKRFEIGNFLAKKKLKREMAASAN